MQEEKEYNGIYIVKTKDVMKATLYDNGCLTYIPRGGLAYLLQKDPKEKLGKLDFIIVKEYDDFYKEYATDLPMAKCKRKFVPLYINEDAEFQPITEEKADKFIEKSKNYQLNFYKLYASAANAIYGYQSMRNSEKNEKQKRIGRR